MSTTTATPTPPPYAPLDPRTRNLLVMPGEDGWDLARTAWNLEADQRPAAVALPETAEDVIALVSWARESGLRIAPQGTGHGATALPDLDGALLLRTSNMRQVDVDPVQRTARAQAGAWWQDVTQAVAPHGLAALAGSSPDVGVAGYTLRGGVSWLARAHGLACNHVRAIELVTPDARLVRATADTEPDLFWALRGGCAALGVVTALELELFAIPVVHAGAMFWDVSWSREVWHAWRRWTADLPETVTSTVRVLAMPPAPEVPEPLRGRTFAIIEAAFLTDEAHADALLRPLRALAPAMDTFATIPAAGLATLHMDPPMPVPGLAGHTMLTSLPAEAVDAMIALVGPDTGSPLLSAEIRHLGGALGRTPEGAGAATGLAGPYMSFTVGSPMAPGSAEAIDRRNRAVEDALSPWASPHPYLNFVEQPTDGSAGFPPAVLARLRAVKQAVDPDDAVLGAHGLRPLER